MLVPLGFRDDRSSTIVIFFFLYFSGCFFFHRTFFNEFIFVCFYLGYAFLLFIICEIMEGGVFPY